MASPSYNGSGTQTGFAGSANIPRPSVSAGDLMLLVIECNNATGTINTPSGWTAGPAVDTGSPYFANIATFTKVAGGSEASDYAISISGGGGGATGIAQIFAWTGSASLIVEDSDGQYNSSSSVDMVCPSVDSGGTDRTLICVYTHGDEASITQPSGMTERRDASFSGLNFGVADEAISSAGATGTRTATGVANYVSAGMSIIIAESGGGGGGSNVPLSIIVPNQGIFLRQI